MSSTSIAEYEKTDLIEQYCYLAGAVLFCYDYCLTFDREVEYFWKAKLSPIALLFYVMRYTGLFTIIFVMLESSIKWTARSDLSCSIVVHLDLTLLILTLCCAAMFSAARVYALFGHAKRLFVVTLCLGLINPAINIV
ncbi:hypothetical protein B0H21DRAFT_751393, partial [Amylocystis lapponica]